MTSFLADENFNRDILRGVASHRPDLDILRAQDVGLDGADDPTILAWAADQGRLVLTHDVRTMTRFAYERAARGEPMPGVFEVNQEVPIGRAIEDILILAECTVEGEWEGQVRYLPI